MNKQQQFLKQACEELGVEIALNHEVKLASGNTVVAQALVRNIGAPRGMLVFASTEDIKNSSPELLSLGYGYTVYALPLPEEEFDLDSYKEMFDDWGGVR